VRRVLLIFSVLLVTAALVLTYFAPQDTLTRGVQIVAAAGVIGVMLLYVTGLMKSARPRPAPSLIAEMERLYFRAMREMLNDQPNLAQVVNDLQRILSIDSHYKNARHYLQRALILQEQSGEQVNGARLHSRAEFMRLQEKLIDLDPAVRKAVVMELIHYGEMAVDPLTALLMDDDADVRVHAATALGWVGGPDAVQPLLVALQDAEPLVRRYAARALCWVVDDTAVEGLITALQDEDTYVRSYAARALGWSQDTRAILPLQTLLEDSSGDVRKYAITALEDLGQRQHQATPGE
jgi:HEAT repeat protein